MTLNEARDQLVAEFPGRTIKVGASCWHWSHMSPNQKDETKFLATIFDPGIAGCITFQEEANSLPSLLEIVRTRLAAEEIADEIAEALPEPV